MEEFGDWIYLLIIAIAGLFSLVGSSRKKAQQMAEANQQQQPREIITDHSDEDYLWDDSIPKAEKKPATATPFSSSSKQKKPFLNRFQEGHPALMTNQSEEFNPSNSPEEYDSFTIDDIPKNAHDWRTVFIYNEIFSRKS